MPPQPIPFGLAWDVNIPSFAIEPDVMIIQSLVRQHLLLADSTICAVSFLAGGTFNKVYQVEIVSEMLAPRLFVFRVSLPIEMPHKVESEVATIRFLRQNTTAVPIPKVYAFDPTNENDLMFPWMLMDFVNGKPLDFKRWQVVSFEKKVVLTKQLAQFQSQVFDLKFDSIGSLHHCPSSPLVSSTVTTSPMDNDSSPASPTMRTYGKVILFCVCYFIVAASHGLAWLWSLLPRERTLRYDGEGVYFGRTVNMDFVLAFPNTTRGPFKTTVDWLSTRLADSRDRQGNQVMAWEGESNASDWEEMKTFSTRLLDLVPKIFTTGPEPTVLFLHDIHVGNVLIDDNGDLAGLVDWEFTATSPLWLACQYPKLLEPWKDRDTMPTREQYPPMYYDYLYEPGDDVSSDYYEHIQDYEKKKLKDLFMSEMDRLQPGWIQIFRESQAQREFHRLIRSAMMSDVFDPREYTWLDRFEQGKPTEKVFTDGYDDEDTDESSSSGDDEGDDDGSDVDEEEGEQVESQSIENVEEADNEDNVDTDLDSEHTLYDPEVDEVTPDTTLVAATAKEYALKMGIDLGLDAEEEVQNP